MCHSFTALFYTCPAVFAVGLLPAGILCSVCPYGRFPAFVFSDFYIFTLQFFKVLKITERIVHCLVKCLVKVTARQSPHIKPV